MTHHVAKRSIQTLLLVLVMAVSYWMIANIFAQSNNSLYKNQNWIVSKTLLKKPVFGAYGYLGSSNVLVGEHLDLSAWHGFQEVIYKEAVAMRELRFDFLLYPDAYLNVLFHKTETGFAGIRISLYPPLGSKFFLSSPEGEFLLSEPLTLPNLRPRTWHHARLMFEAGHVLFEINGVRVKELELNELGAQQFGFRGGMQRALVNHIQARDPRGSLILNESFKHRHTPRANLAALAVVLAFNSMICLMLFLIWPAFGKPKALSKMLVLNFFFMIGSGLVLQVFESHLLRRYPNWADFANRMPARFMAESKKYWDGSWESFVRQQIQEKYSKEPAEGVSRILFVGSSQTWGAGASDASRAFVSRLEKKLNAQAPSSRLYECVNAGISGLESSRLWALYQSDWLRLKPALVVIVLSSNDKNPQVFEDSLERFIQHNQKTGIQTLLVMEPNAAEMEKPPLAMYDVMRRVGARYHVPTFDLHTVMLKQYDRGFLWWDYVHLTDFGHKLMADMLYDPIRQMTAPAQPSQSAARAAA